MTVRLAHAMRRARTGAVAVAVAVAIAVGAFVTLTAPAVHADPIDDSTTNIESSSAGDAAPDQPASITARPQRLEFKIGRFFISNR